MRVSVAIVASCVFFTSLAATKYAAATIVKETHIPPEPLRLALEEFARDRNLQLVYATDEVGNFHSAGAVGNLTASDALQRLLRGTGLTYQFVDERTVTVGSAAIPTTQSTGERPMEWRTRLAQAESPHAGPSSDQATTEKNLAQLDEFVVTARKVAERIQDVPDSIVALRGADLESANINSLEDIGRALPGINVVSQGPGRNTLVIRGLSAGNAAGGTASMVGYYIDDIPIMATAEFSSGLSDPAVFDLERVEVLRGPQGTLYGASSMGGTIKYVTEQPELREFSGWSKASTSYTARGGSNGEVDTVANLPVIDNLLAVRVGAFYRYNDGYIDRYDTSPTDILAVLPGAVSRNVNWEKTYGGRIVVKLQPNEHLTVSPSVYFQNMKLGGQFSIDYPPGTFDNPIQSRPVAEPTLDNLRLYALSIHGDWRNVSIASTTSYFDRRNDETEDDSKETFYFYQPTQSRVYPIPFYLNFPNHNLTQELRVSFNVSRLSGLLGVFYSDVVGDSAADWVVPDGYYAAFGNIFGGQTAFYKNEADVKDVQRAIFGQLTYEVTPKLKLTIGGRAFNQRQSQVISASGVFQGVPATNNVVTRASGFTPKYNAAYAVTDDAMIYATASKGFRGGGTFVPIPYAPCAADLTAIGLSQPPDSFKPDTLWNYEFGVKTQWLDRRLTVNADIYNIKWKDMQQSVNLYSCGFSFTGNYGTATSKGAELEIEARPVAPLLVSLKAAVNQSQLTSTVTGVNGVAGQELPYAPKWAGSVTAEYTKEISATASLYGRFDANATSRQYRGFNPMQLNYVQAGYTLMNARVGMKLNRWDVSLFATNLLDKKASTSEEGTYSLSIPPTYRATLQQPRVVGIEARLTY